MNPKLTLEQLSEYVYCQDCGRVVKAEYGCNCGTYLQYQPLRLVTTGPGQGLVTVPDGTPDGATIGQFAGNLVEWAARPHWSAQDWADGYMDCDEARHCAKHQLLELALEARATSQMQVEAFHTALNGIDRATTVDGVGKALSDLVSWCSHCIWIRRTTYAPSQYRWPGSPRQL